MRSWSLHGNAEAVVIFCFWVLESSYGVRDDVRIQVTRRVLVYLGADHSILDDFYARSGVFSGISAWAYNLQTDADYDGEQSENEEEATPEGKSFEDKMRDILTELSSEVIEIAAASAKDGSSDLYCCRCPDGVFKVGYCLRKANRDVKDRLKELEEKFHSPHVLRVLWKNAGHSKPLCSLLSKSTKRTCKDLVVLHLASIFAARWVPSSPPSTRRTSMRSSRRLIPLHAKGLM